VRLRRLLTLTVGVLLVVALVVTDVVAYTQLRSFLYGKVDDQLDAAQQQAFTYLHFASRFDIPLWELRRGLASRVSPDVYVMVLGPSNKVIVRLPSGARSPSGNQSHPDPQPRLPAALRPQPTLVRHRFGQRIRAYRPSADSFDVGAVGDHSAAYRATAVRVPQGILVVAVSLNPTQDTLSSLLRIELIASGLALVVITGLAYLVVRRGLRPLEEMTRTAGAIAGGDLTRRVPANDAQSEVGRLGNAFNAMLGRIQASFEEKSASEARLRQFVANASHELRTPLTSIRGYTELLRKGAFGDEASRHRALSRVEREAERMSAMVEDLLLLARLDQGRPLERVAVDLRRIAADAVDDARAVQPSRPIDLVAPERVVVVGDRDRLGQVAHNLVRNALDHTPLSARVEVAVRRDAAMGILEVRDEGPGMEPEQAARVFDRFYRADSARTGRGTGLGLAIVRAIALALEGTASVDSVVGEGTVFRVEIPLEDAAGPPGARPGVPSAGALEQLSSSTSSTGT